MTVYFDKGRANWRFDFWRRGVRHSGYCVHPTTKLPASNRREATEIELLAKARIMQSIGPAVSVTEQIYRLAQASIPYATRAQRKPSWPSIARHIEELLTWFGPATPVAAITEARMAEYVAWALSQHVETWVGGPYKRDELRKRAGDAPLWKKSERVRDARTVNRYLDTLRAILRLAHRTLDPQTRRPLLESIPEIPYEPIAEETPKPFALATLKNLIDDAPDHVAETIILALIFGFRLRQALDAKASRVDLALGGYWLEARSRGNKGKRGAFVPFGPATREFVESLVERARSTGLDNLILYRDHRTNIWRPIKSISTAWTKLLQRHGLKGLHTFHNTKTTLVSNIADLATPAVVQDLAQHRDFRTTRKHYIAIADDPKRQALTELEERLAVAGIRMLRPKLLPSRP